MTNSSKDKGDRGELEVQSLLRDLLGDERVRRSLGAGRKDDVGDIDGVPQTAVQVVWTKAWTQAINTKLPMVEQQRKNKRVRFAALWVRRDRNPIPWIVVMTPAMWVKLHRYAMMGVRASHYKWCPECERERPVRFFRHDTQAADRISAKCEECLSKTRSAQWGERRRKFVQEEMGGRCVQCGFDDDWRALQIDHVNGGGTAEAVHGAALYRLVRENPEQYQLLCANCNVIKAAENNERAKTRGQKGTLPTERRLTPLVIKKIAKQQVALEREQKAAKMAVHEPRKSRPPSSGD